MFTVNDAIPHCPKKQTQKTVEQDTTIFSICKNKSKIFLNCLDIMCRLHYNEFRFEAGRTALNSWSSIVCNDREGKVGIYSQPSFFFTLLFSVLVLKYYLYNN